jgi:hypothetical protein
LKRSAVDGVADNAGEGRLFDYRSHYRS